MVIGAGGIGLGTYKAGSMSSGQVVASPKATWSGPKLPLTGSESPGYADYHDLLDQPDIDAVTVPSPVLQRRWPSRRWRPESTFCWKSRWPSMAEAAQVVMTAKKMKRILMVNQFRSRQTQIAKQGFNGDLGRFTTPVVLVATFQHTEDGLVHTEAICRRRLHHRSGCACSGRACI